MSQPLNCTCSHFQIEIDMLVSRRKKYCNPLTESSHPNFNVAIVFGTSLCVCQLTALWGTGEGKNIATFSKCQPRLHKFPNPPAPPNSMLKTTPSEEVETPRAIASWTTTHPRAPSTLNLGVRGDSVKGLQYFSFY